MSTSISMDVSVSVSRGEGDGEYWRRKMVGRGWQEESGRFMDVRRKWDRGGQTEDGRTARRDRYWTTRV